MATVTESKTALRELPTEPIEKWMRRRINDGLSPEEASDEALSPLEGSGYYHWAKPGMRSLARSVHRQVGLRLERSALNPTSSESVWRTAVKRLTAWTFKDGSGNDVVWNDSTREDHQSRILWITGHMNRLDEDRVRHSCALELFDEHNADRLGDIAGWEELWRQKVLGCGIDPVVDSNGLETA